MFANLKNVINQGKDRAISAAIVQAFNHKLKEYGEVLEFNLNSKEKTITLEVMLDGEKEPLHVKVNSYEILNEGDKSYIVAKDIVTSRAWINTLASQHLNNQKFEIPAEYANILKMVV
jgi:hypothetical protein